MYEYKVIEIREGLVGDGSISGAKLQDLLNEHGQDGWRLAALTAAQVKGRVGPSSVEGVIVTLERASSRA